MHFQKRMQAFLKKMQAQGSETSLDHPRCEWGRKKKKKKKSYALAGGTAGA
jgi:hypothetical protein